MREALPLQLVTLFLFCAVAGCQPSDKQHGDEALENRSNKGPPSKIAAAKPQEIRSIIRSEIVKEEPPPSAIEPVEAVVMFDDRTSTLSNAARTRLNELLDTPTMRTGGPVTLRGHSDSRGSDDDNLAVSRIRAEAVKDYLVKKGVKRERITVLSLGETRPIAPNARPDGTDYPEGRAKNRRVEILVQPVSPERSVTPEE